MFRAFSPKYGLSTDTSDSDDDDDRAEYMHDKVKTEERYWNSCSSLFKCHEIYHKLCLDKIITHCCMTIWRLILLLFATFSHTHELYIRKQWYTMTIRKLAKAICCLFSYLPESNRIDEILVETNACLPSSITLSILFYTLFFVLFFSFFPSMRQQ